MGFLNRIFGKKEKEADKGPRVIGMGEVREVLTECRDGAGEEVLDRSEDLMDDIVHAAREIGDILEAMEGKEFPEEMEKKMYKPIKTSLPRYINGMRTAVEGLQAPTGEMTLEAYGEFHRRTLQALKSIEKVQIGSGRYVALAFEGEMMKIGTNLNNIIDTGREIGESLEDHNKTIAGVEEADDLLEDIHGQEERIKEVEESPSVIRDKVRSAEEKIGQLEEELKTLSESQEYRDMQAQVEEREQVKFEIKKIKNSVFTSLSPLGRLFRKYQKLMEGTKDEAVLARLSEDPRTMVMDGYDPGLIISKMKKAVQDGYLSMKEKEKKHLWPKLETAMDTDYQGMIEEMRTLETRKGEIEASLKESTIGNKKAKLEKEIERSRARLEKLKNEPQDVEKEKEELETEYQEMVERLEGIVGELLDTEVHIDLDSG